MNKLKKLGIIFVSAAGAVFALLFYLISIGW